MEAVLESSGRAVQPARILVVDDEPDLEILVRQRFRRLIRDGRMEFVFARNGDEALKVLQRDVEIDVLLTDINMPVMDGLTLLRLLQQVTRVTKAVVVSAYGDMSNIRTAMNRGAFDFVTKPINFEDLEATIEKTLTYVQQTRDAMRAEEYRIAKEVAEQNYRQLKALEQLRDDLTHMIVHDLRVPLTSIISGLQTLQVIGDLNADQAEMLSISLDGGQMLLDLINDLLDISKCEDGSMQLEYAPVSPAALVDRSLRDLGYLAQTRGVALNAELPAEDPELRADEDKLRRMLSNLVGNALKFTPREGLVTVSARHDGDVVRFDVRDTGEGIPAEAFDRIFDKFGQVESRKAGRMMSTGLGLTFCKMAAEAHGGRIWVESRLGEGSTFSFVIPSEPSERSSA